MNDDVKLAKWLNDEMDAQELKEFESLPEYATYSKIKKYSAALTAPAADMDALYSRINKNKYAAAQPKVRRINVWIPRVAAVLFIALGLSFFLYAAHTTTEAAAVAQTTSFALPDDSQVVLNAGTEASYKEFNWSNNRMLELKGEAYFKAAKGKTFDVVTPLGTITVVGTQFNIKARGNRLDVTCYEGKVKVTTPTETVLLTPGKTVSYEDGRNLHVPDAKASEPGWVRHETLFVMENITNVVDELERQFGVTIELAGPVSKKSYNATIPTKDMNTALDLVRSSYNLSYKKQGNKIILTAE